ncbi:MAG: Rpn family recombination-promoting nuclease/putative transposase, partial [Acidobacteriota bacterium]
LLEHKSAPDGWVAFQLLRYIMRLWEQRFEQGCEKLPLVIPIVFYHGKERWTISPQFSTLVESAGLTALSKHIPDFEYLLRDVSLRGSEEIKGGPRLKTGLSLMRYIFSDDLGQRLPAIFRNLRDMRWADVLEYLQTLLAYLSKAGRKVKKEEVDDAMLELLPKEEIGTEAPFAQSWIQEGMEKGMEKGVQLGQHLGMASLSLRLVQRRFGQVDEMVSTQIRALPNPMLEEFGEALFDFASPEEMRRWLAEHSSNNTIS